MEKYDPIRVIGEGSFGKVYLMRDKSNRKFLCVKVIKIKNIPKKEREATRIEVDLLRRLHHPNIVRYVDSFLSKNGESLCIAMEYCDGGDLASQIKTARRNLFSEDKILHWFVQICLGLHYMHNNKVLHRDLKTQNIFLLGNGRLVLGDLGISKVLEGTMDFAQTCIGTPYYMSPEIFKNKPYSYKSDIWALGCVLYEMTTLNHAFDANSLNGLAQKIVRGSYPPIHHKYSRFLKDLINDVLAVNPAQRPDCDQILRKPFIRKHVVNFFVDVASRPTQSIGEGTMIVRAAGGGPLSGFGSDANMISLKQQLDGLGLAEAIQQSLNSLQRGGKEVIQDPVEAKKIAKEAASALKREEEHKKIVEAALEKLRREREVRAQERAAQEQLKRQKDLELAQNRGRPAYGGMGAPAQSKASLAANPIANGPSNNPLVARKNSIDNAAAARENAILARQEEERKRRVEIEERRLAAESKLKAERDKRLVAEAKEREEVAAKIQRDHLKAQQEAVQRREQQLYLERERQRMAIEQLSKDKLELDKRVAEKQRRTEEKMREEKRRLDQLRAEQVNNRPEPVYAVDRRVDNSDVSARDRVIARKLDRQLKEEQEYYEAARQVSVANKALREAANNQNRQQIYGYGADPITGRAYQREPVKEEAAYEFESADKRSKPQPRRSIPGNMNMDLLNEQMDDIAKVQPSRFGDMGNANPASIISATVDDNILEETFDSIEEDVVVPPAEVLEEEDLYEEELIQELTMATKRCGELKQTLQNTKVYIENDVKSNPRGGSNTSVTSIAKTGGGKGLGPVVSSYEDDDDEFADNDKYEVEEESYDDDELPSYSVAQPAPAPVSNYQIRAGGNIRSDNSTSSAANAVYRPVQPYAAPVSSSAREYSNLHDAPSPSGKLSDRIFRLRQKCLDTFGKKYFDEAYQLIRNLNGSEDEDRYNGLYDNDMEEDKMQRVRRVVGDKLVRFVPLIDQLIFMEDTYSS